jgi:protease-4
MNFLKYIFASALGTLLAGLILVFFVFVIAVSVISFALDDIASGDKVTVKEKTVLLMNFDAPIVERAPKDDFEIPGFTEKKLGLDKLVETLDKASKDEKIEGVLLAFNSIQGGAATTEVLRDALLDFKASGKWIVAYSESYSQKGYYLASVANEIYLNPEGSVFLAGLSYKPLFLKDMFDKIGVEMQVIRGTGNKFKSAVEPFMYNEMSEANREQSSQLIGSVWTHLTQGMAEERGMDVAEINRAADELSLFFAEEAVEKRFVDGLKYHDEIQDLLAEKLELDEWEKDHMVSYDDYKRVKLEKTKVKDLKKSKIALVYAVGEIQSGEGDDETIGSDRIAAAIRKARKDTTVKAIVFRVNSPGGSALASDVIWREVVLASDEKPFAVSMGDLAASGGYYISCASDRIFAEPTTITGSIGVFGVVPNAKELMNKKLGLHIDGVKTNENADMMDISKPLNTMQYAIIQKGVDDIYSEFLGKVAEGRGLTTTYVDSIGQGRVWTGTDALDLGLVDEIGGMQEAIDWVAAQAELDDYRLKSYPKIKSPMDELMQAFNGQGESRILEKAFSNYELKSQAAYIESIINMEGIQARMPYYISFE